eukprot:gb/GECG01010049.1/.p1 GENE.gb/GECG01010049.1/~~gb/GECG01010049.1/.p1  ORF type:complete len:303 (+),score=41.72 gb/GECG01010049.1/:1-909(+)
MSRSGSGPVRRASHAGSWYTDNPRVLEGNIEKHFEKAKHPSSTQGRDGVKVKAIIGPHAGYRFCGHVMASAYSELKERVDAQNISRVILFGPSHHVYTDKCELPTATEYQTPLGSLQVDQKLKEEVASKGRFGTFPVEAEEDEHSLEMHLPYIVKVFGTDVSFLPVVVGALDDSAEEYYGRLFAEFFDDPNTVFLVSSDFCHWGKKFRYTRYNKDDGEIWESVTKLDQESMEAIKTQDPASFRRYLQKTGNTICGRHPILLLMEVLTHSTGHKVEFFDYDQSNKAKSEDDMSVSYGAGIVWK